VKDKFSKVGVLAITTGAAALAAAAVRARLGLWRAVFCGVLSAVGVFPVEATETMPHWVASWAASQYEPEPQNRLPPEELRDATLRQVVHLSLGGTTLRVRLSNVVGTAPLHITATHVARALSPGSSAIDPTSDTAVTFAGEAAVTIPAGADYVSDPITFSAADLSDMAVTLHLDSPPANETGHPGARATAYLSAGDAVSARDMPNPHTVDHWYYLAGVDVLGAAQAAAIVTLGDSITDGHGATTNGNDRWPDQLARRLLADPRTRHLAIVNEGIGGNRLLQDGSGPNALARLDRDVLSLPGARYVIVLEGINDLGSLTRNAPVPFPDHRTLVRQMIGAYQQIIARARAHGLEVFGATLIPYAQSPYYHPQPVSEGDRQEINAWIRASGEFDGVIDFDRVIRDPSHPQWMQASFDSGDGLHPGPAGYQAMAGAVPLAYFMEGKPTVARQQSSARVRRAQSARQPESRPNALRLALTFDDLPVHGPLPPGETRVRIARAIVSALQTAKAPPVYGFINAASVDTEPDSAAVLTIWRDAGLPLGNHAWSHMDAAKHPVEDFEADVQRNEPLLRTLMSGADWHWLRYPYLSEGDTPEQRAQLRTFLGTAGYRVAGVTMSFSDYLFNEPYARCVSKGDKRAVAGLERDYLSAAEDSLRFSRAMSHELYGRDIPYVLLMHIGAFDARMLPRLLRFYRAQGVELVSLEEAQADPWYAHYIDLRQAAGPRGLEAAMDERHLALPARTDYSPTLDALCR
jgi:lysophospholipase L1-like esterase/peptidoglycan/xylan/chitin deacetylase (PgdA/CDA1 family)